MEKENPRHPCGDCNSARSRRDFLATAASAAAAATALPLFVNSRTASAAPTVNSPAESAVRRLYDSLNDEQRPIVALPFDDHRRSTINPNWQITKATIGEFFSKEQQEIIHEILRGATSEDGYERFLKQMASDNAPGIAKYSVALFGDPHKDKFQFEMTGRHLTLRADGDTLPGACFGGPIVYGHSAKGDSDKNLFSYQTKRANELFKALDGKQHEKALLDKAPEEAAVKLRKEGRPRPGISVGELSEDQKDLVKSVLKDVMRPYRKEDVDEAIEIVHASGGLDALNFAFYKEGDLSDDKSWDIWRIEGPTMVCHFRGAPHVHAYLNIRQRS